ncbi:hypothetical protein [Sphingomonas sanguinis]|uniref:hypothetical protein n=1 Tax=Sphingomonas sanguinis TaxID=33051 RepID=UPI00077BB83C|nr:hypothetical protein [Sphingomonas sanguinis]
MTVAKLPRINEYVGAAGPMSFPIKFQFLTQADISVALRDAQGNETIAGAGSFTVSGGDGNKGAVTFSVGTAGFTVVIRGRTEISQKTEYPFGTNFPSFNHERTVDRAAMIDQEQQDQIEDARARSLMLPAGSIQPDFTSADFDGPVKVLTLDPVTRTVQPADSRAFAGVPGVGGNTFLTLQLLRDLDPTKYQSATLADGVNPPVSYAYVAGNFTGKDDNVNVVRLNVVPLSVGALVRQGAQSVSYASPVAIGAPQGQDEVNLKLIDVYDAMTLSMRAAFRSGSRSYDAGPALQAIMDYAQGANSQADAAGGVELQWREGVYVTSKGLTNRFRADKSIIDDNDLRRMNMRGGGSANTALIYNGPNDGVAYDVRGVNDGPGRDLYHVVKGMRLLRFPLNSRTATGMRARYVADLHMEDFMVYGFATGLLLQDVLGVSADRLWVLANDVGMRMGLVDWTNPNVCRFTNGRFGGNQSIAAHIIRGANIGFYGTRWEGNGADRSNTAITLLYEGGPPEGAHALTLDDNYFENNRGIADASFAWASPYDGIVTIRDTTFHRAFPVGGVAGSERYVQHHVDTAVVGAALAAGSKLHIVHDGNGYKSFGDYTPSPLRKVLRVQSPDNTFVREGQNYYQNDIERPETNNGPFIGATYPVVSVTVEATGAYDLDTDFTVNVATVTKTGTGVYRVSYRKQPRQPLRVNPTATLFNGMGTATISGRANEYLEVTTLDTTGAPADRAFTLNALGSF